MKKFVLFLLLFPLLSPSQEIFQKEIIHTLNFTISDLAELPDNEYLGCGYLSPSGYDSSLSVIFKMDSLMQVLWCKRLKMLRMDDLVCLTPLSDGNFVTAGASRYEYAKDYGGNLYKIDASGNVIWNRI